MNSKVSLVIPTYNGKDKLPVTLAAILKQTVLPDEIVIVIDGSTDGTEEWLRDNFFFDNLSVVSQDNKGRAGARNSGVKHATGNLLIFIDDDIKVNADFIENHLKLHKEYPNSIITGAAWQEFTGRLNDDFSKFMCYLEDGWKAQFPNKPVYKATMSDFGCSAANLSIDRAIFKSLNGFDERLTDGEDFDLGVRALKANTPLYHAPLISTSHRDFITIEKYIGRHVQHYKENEKLSTIHPDYKELFPHMFNLKKPSFLKSVFRKVFILNPIWSILLKSQVFLNLIPQNIRFKLYDLIISSTVFRRLNLI